MERPTSFAINSQRSAGLALNLEAGYWRRAASKSFCCSAVHGCGGALAAGFGVLAGDDLPEEGMEDTEEAGESYLWVGASLISIALTFFWIDWSLALFISSVFSWEAPL